MARTKISEYSATPSDNTDIDGINIAEGCAPSGINNAIREMMSQLKDFQAGTQGDPFNGPHNGTVGATTASTGAFTTLSASGAVTLSGGTANGVPYLNGSKVLTSGTALVFDGTNFGIGTTAPQARLHTYGSGTVSNYISTSDSGGVNLYLQVSATSANIGSPNGVPLTLMTSNTVRATLDIDGNLNIGSNKYFGLDTNAKYIPDDASVGGAIYTGGGFRFFTGGANERMRLDSSGNLGLGVTPSAWGTGWKAFQSNLTAVADYYGTYGVFSLNNFADKYITTAAATKYQQTDGQHQWFYAPSGTAGNAISFTQAMTLDASGNLLVGTTSGSGRITAVSAFAGVGGIFYGTGSGSKPLLVYNSVSTGATSSTQIEFANNAGGTVGTITSTGSATAYNTSSDYRLKNITGPITTSGAYIDSLNPVEGTWKANGSTFVGLIAHEVQEASRTQVATGVKDGEEMQGMDYSNAELIANLIAEVKSLRQRLASAGI